MSNGSDGAIGFLGFDIGVDNKAIDDLLKQLDQIKKLAEQRLALKNADSLTSALKETNTAAKGLSTTVTDLGKSSKALGGELDKVGAGAKTVKRETDSLVTSMRSVSNSVRDYQLKLEAGDISQDEFVRGVREVIGSAKILRQGVSDSSTEYGRLTGIIRTATTSINTAEGRINRLGISQQVALGHTSRLRDSVTGLGTGFLTLGNALPGVIGVAGLGGLATVAGRLATEANAANVATDILALTINRVGASSSVVDESISNTADALGVAEGQVVDYATQLLRIGVAADQIDDVLVAGGASALAFGKSAAQGLDSVTNALVTGNSANLQTIGISENVGAAMNEAADAADNLGEAASKQASAQAADNLGEAASKQASAQAGVNIVLKATQDEVDSLDKLTAGLAGSQNEAATAAYEARQALGELLIPLETMRNQALVGVLDLFNEMPGTFQAGAIGLGTMSTAAVALSGAFGVLKTASAALFSPPAGIILGGIAVAVGLGTAIFQMAEKHESAAEKLKRLETAADDLASPLAALKEVTSKDQLLGAVESLAETMDGEAKTAFENYAESALESAKTTGEAVLNLYAYILDYRKKLKEDALEEAQEILANAQERADAVQADPGRFSGDGLAELQVQQFQEMLANGRQALQEQQALLNKALEDGNKALAAKYTAGIATLKGSIAEVEGKLREALTNLPEAQINLATDAENEALRTVQRLQTELGEINGLLAGGTRADFEAYFGSITTGASDAGEENDGLNDSLTDTGTTADDAGGSLKTYAERVRELVGDTGEFARQISTRFVTGAIDAGDAMSLLTVRLGDAKAAKQALLEGAFYKPEELAALNTEIVTLEGALDEISPDSFNTLGVGATAAYDPVAGLRAQLQGTNDDLAQGQEDVGQWGEVYKRVYGETGEILAEASRLEGEAFRDRARNQAEYVVAAEELANITAYYGREVESSVDSITLQQEANQENLDVLEAVIRATSDAGLETNNLVS
jgi:hypothetical protein